MDDGRGGRDVAEPAQLTPTRWARVWSTRGLLLRVARGRGAGVEDAEDAVQEAMLRAAEHPEIPEERLQVWLVAVTIRLCMDGHRRRAREARRWQRASAYAAVQQSGQHLEDEACERSEAVWVASLAAEILPPRQVQALRLTAAGCDVQQVASQLGVRYRAAESLLARARRTVRIAATAGLGVLAWAWRAHMPTAANPIPMALASATATTMMVVAIPTVLPGPGWPGSLSDQPSAAGPMTAVPTGESFVVPIPTPIPGPASPPGPAARRHRRPGSRAGSGVGAGAPQGATPRRAGAGIPGCSHPAKPAAAARPARGTAPRRSDSTPARPIDHADPAAAASTTRTAEWRRRKHRRTGSLETAR
ncbi:MAG: sigma-70 family RNA polymerase sigma factor, partial [Actinobacteria bacterium]|nr:sigma-70 family RNA polymerase sigma factor [Actinomycetota bacterium]